MRVFFALWPDADAGEALAKLAHDVAAQAGGRAPAPENLHLTLAFVGEVAASRADALRAIGQGVAAAATPFTLALDEVGAFRRAGIAWAGAATPPAELLRLVAHLNDALAAGGFPVDPRPFQAHVTLARRCRRSPAATHRAAIAWEATRIVLNASELAAGGARYREVAGWSLGCGRAGEQSP